MATIAVFVALSAGAYALSRNSVKSKHIKNGQVKLADTNDNLRLKCPQGTLYLLAGCIDRDTRPAQAQSAAATTCRGVGRRLPTAAELLTLERTGRLTVEELSGEIDATPSGFQAVTVEPNADEQRLQLRGDPFAFRCVAEPRR